MCTRSTIGGTTNREIKSRTKILAKRPGVRAVPCRFSAPWMNSRTAVACYRFLGLRNCWDLREPEVPASQQPKSASKQAHSIR